MEMNYTVQEIATLIQAEVVGDATLSITGLNSLKDASEGDVAFLSDKRFHHQLKDSKATAVIVHKSISSDKHTLLRVDDPDAAFNKIVVTVKPAPRQPEPGIHATAIIHASANIDETASIGPYCVIEEGVHVGAHSVLHAHVVVDRNCCIGEHTVIWPLVAIREECQVGDHCLFHSGVVIGFDGFGFNNVQGEWQKVPQLGNVIIGNHVELAASVTVARARFGSTIIEDGVKVDASAQIGHGAKIGHNSYLGAQSGFGGSCVLGSYVTMAPHSGVGPSVKIASQVILGAQSATVQDIKEKGSYWGMPAIPHLQEIRRIKNTEKLPAFFDEIKELRKKIEALESTKNHK